MELWAALTSIAFGALGFLIAEFWLRPVLKYREAKFQVVADLVFYANAVSPVVSRALPDHIKARSVAQRTNAAQLRACIWSLPPWYRWWLRRRGENPAMAARALIGFSNTFEHRDAASYRIELQQALRLPKNLDDIDVA